MYTIIRVRSFIIIKYYYRCVCVCYSVTKIVEIHVSRVPLYVLSISRRAAGFDECVRVTIVISCVIIHSYTYRRKTLFVAADVIWKRKSQHFYTDDTCSYIYIIMCQATTTLYSTHVDYNVFATAVRVGLSFIHYIYVIK